jgi:hypothetical protein
MNPKLRPKNKTTQTNLKTRYQKQFVALHRPPSPYLKANRPFSFCVGAALSVPQERLSWGFDFDFARKRQTAVHNLRINDMMTQLNSVPKMLLAENASLRKERKWLFG